MSHSFHLSRYRFLPQGSMMKFSFSRFESRSETANVSRRSSPAASASIAVKVGVLFLLSTASCPGQDGGPEFGHGLQILTGDARIEGSTNMTVGCCGSDSDSGYVGDQKSYVPSRRHDRGLPVTAKDSGVAVAITDCASAAVNYGAGASVHPGSVTTTAFLMGDTFGDYLCAIIDESFMEGESSGTWRVLCRPRKCPRRGRGRNPPAPGGCCARTLTGFPSLSGRLKSTQT